MYGETVKLQADPAYGGGLSPHVRGNLSSPVASCRVGGSIPACTGKPITVTVTVTITEVYPRMYGETISRQGVVTVVGGLSPHVRGNQAHRPARQQSLGSIPACTGKPAIPKTTAAAAEVYPRMYGETNCIVTVNS